MLANNSIAFVVYFFSSIFASLMNSYCFSLSYCFAFVAVFSSSGFSSFSYFIMLWHESSSLLSTGSSPSSKYGCTSNVVKYMKYDPSQQQFRHLRPNFSIFFSVFLSIRPNVPRWRLSSILQNGQEAMFPFPHVLIHYSQYLCLE